MRKSILSHRTVMLCVILSFSIKLFMVLYYKNLLNLSSDDLNYIKSAMALAEKNIFTFDQFNEPTVFVMPLYPLFLASIFKVLGYGLLALQVIRTIQVILSCVIIVLVFLIAQRLFNEKIATLASVLVSFYIPNITTPGYLLTETLFTFLFLVLIYYSLMFSENPSSAKYAFLGLIWALAVMIRPTIFFYPILLFSYLAFSRKINFRGIIKLGVVMVVTFSFIMSPWWVRNFKEYGEFIPLSAASGNPMLQGTYINYKQTEGDTVYYKLGNNAIETNKIEVEVAKKRIVGGFRSNFWSYLGWYTVGKTVLFWCGVFYWREFLGISKYIALGYHYIILVGLIGIIWAARKNFIKYFVPISVILYFNLIHCLYMTFDRYAYPVIPIVTVFSAYFIYCFAGFIKSYLQNLYKNCGVTK